MACLIKHGLDLNSPYRNLGIKRENTICLLEDRLEDIFHASHLSFFYNTCDEKLNRMVLRGHAFLFARMKCDFNMAMSSECGHAQTDTKTSVATKVIISPQKTTLHYIVNIFILPSV